MNKYIIKRLLLLIPVLIGVSLVVFVMLEITPGDPARQLAGSDASEEAVEQLREEMGLNDPALTDLSVIYGMRVMAIWENLIRQRRLWSMKS